MFIRRTQIKSRQHREPYYTYRLVESERVQGRMKQRILLNLGRHFEVPKSDWRALSSRIEQLLEGQTSLLSIELSPVRILANVNTDSGDREHPTCLHIGLGGFLPQAFTISQVIACFLRKDSPFNLIL